MNVKFDIESVFIGIGMGFLVLLSFMVMSILIFGTNENALIGLLMAPAFMLPVGLYRKERKK